MAVGEVLIGWGIATASGGLGSYLTWVRGRNDASRDAVLQALIDWMAAWSDVLNLGTSSVVTVGRVAPVDPVVVREVLSALSRATHVCLVTCEQKPVAQTSAMFIIATQRLAPLLQAGGTREEWTDATGEAVELERVFVDTVRKI